MNPMPDPAPTDPLSVLDRYLDAYARRDLPAIRALLAPDVRLQDWHVCGEGIDFVCRETQRNFEAARSLQIERQHHFVAPGRVAAQLRIVVDGDVSLEVVDVLTLDRTGRITGIRAYKG